MEVLREFCTLIKQVFILKTNREKVFIMSKIFVTGATGLIGIKLVQRLKEEGHEVAGFTTSENGQQKLAAVNVKAYIGDILKADTIDQALADFKPEIIINQITDLKMLIWQQIRKYVLKVLKLN